MKDAVVDEFGYTERYLSFYDIFVRNAFGNYRDILKEISYNPVMAMTLSFLDSKSSGYMLEKYKIKASPGESDMVPFTFLPFYCPPNRLSTNDTYNRKNK